MGFAIAWAVMAGGGQGAQGQGGGGFAQMIFIMVSFFAIVYFLMIRPQQKRQKSHQKMMEALKKGDRVLTTGGMYGTIVGIKDDVAVLRIADEVKVEIARSSIQSVVGKE